MGIGGISIWQLLIVLAIILLLFGGKRLRNLGGDLGTAIKGFRSSIKEEPKNITEEDNSTIEVEANNTVHSESNRDKND